MQRTIETPDKEWSTDKEAADWLNVPEQTLVRLADSGHIPEPKRWNKHERRWHWETLVAVSTYLKVGHLKPVPEEAVKKKPGKRTAHNSTSSGLNPA